MGDGKRDALLFAVIVLAGILGFVLIAGGKDRAELEAVAVRASVMAMAAADSASAQRARREAAEREHRAAEAELADSVAVWAARRAAYDATIAQERAEGARVAETLRETLTAAQAAQFDSVEASHAQVEHALTAQVADLSAEVADVRARWTTAEHLLAVEKQVSANLEIEASRWRAVAGAEAQLRRDAERSAGFWKVVSAVEAVGIVGLAIRP